MTTKQKRVFENLRDSDLISRYLQGDKQAFTKLVEIHRKSLVLFNYKILHEYNEAEDAVQEELLILLKILDSGKYKKDRKFGGWLRKAARNYLLHQHRKHSLITEHPGELPDLLFDLQTDENDDAAQEMKKIVFRVIEELPERDVKLLILRYWKKIS